MTTGYSPLNNQALPQILTSCHGVPQQCAYQGGIDQSLKVSKIAGMAHGGSKKSIQKGGTICPAAIPVGHSTFPTFPNQNGIFSTSQNANSASQQNNALSALSKSQAMYDNYAVDIPDGLLGSPQTGGSYGDMTKEERKRAFYAYNAEVQRQKKLRAKRRAMGLTIWGNPRKVKKTKKVKRY